MADEDAPDETRKVEDPAPEELSPEELEAQTGRELPDREAMSVIDVNIVAPVDPAVAADVLSDDAPELANGEQDAEAGQES
jgi:hypothetical protein